MSPKHTVSIPKFNCPFSKNSSLRVFIFGSIYQVVSLSSLVLGNELERETTCTER